MMVDNFSSGSQDTSKLLTQAEMDLLRALLEPEEQIYPWNQTTEESEAYFFQQEQDFLLADWSEEEIAAQTTIFLNTLDSLWAAHAASGISAGAIAHHLQQLFATCIPQNWIEHIAERTTTVSNQLTLSQQLAQCVKQLVPHWTEEDLLVLARPFAYNMRDPENEAVEFVLSKVKSRNWIALTEVEQTKIGLALARCAFEFQQQIEA